MLRELGFMGILRVNPAIVGTMLVFSVMLLAFAIERIWYFLSYAGWSEEFWRKLKGAVQAGRLHEARGMLAQSTNVFARVFYTSINSAHLSRADCEDLVQIEKETNLERLRKRLGLFSTFSFISPLVGLLGTVTGIMQAFSDLGRSGSGGANIVAAGISEALVTTAAGIVVAVPAAILYNYFTYRLRSISVRMNNHSNELVILMYGDKDLDKQMAHPTKKEGNLHAKVIG